MTTGDSVIFQNVEAQQETISRFTASLLLLLHGKIFAVVLAAACKLISCHKVLS